MDWQKTKYEEVPALSVRGRDLRHSLRIVTVAWMFGVVWSCCINCSHVSIFGKMLGFSNLAFGIMTCLPFAAKFFQLLASAMVERTGAVKQPFLRYGTISRLLWAVVALVPVPVLLGVPVPSEVMVAVVLGVMAVSWVLASIAVPPWILWMGKLTPRRIRGRFFARRAQWTTLVQIAAVIGLGWVMDWAYDKSLGDTIAGQPRAMWVMCGLFVVAAVFGTVDIRLFQRIRELLPTDSLPPAQTGPALEGSWLERKGRTARALLWEPMKDHSFRSNVVYGAVVMFSATVGAPFFMLNAIKNVQFSALATNLIFFAIGPIIGILGAQAWGRAVDRWGRKPVLILSTALTIFSVAPWFFATSATGSSLAPLLGLPPGTPVGAYLLGTLACVMGGFAWTGLQLAQQGIWFGFTDGAGKSRYVAAYDILTGFGGAIGAVVGGIVAQNLQVLETHPIAVGAFLWNNWHATFALSMIARAAATVLACRIPDPGCTDTWTVVRQIRMNAYNTMATWLFSPLRVLMPRRRQNKDDQAGDSAV